MSWKLAWKNLKRNKRRTISTGMAICVGFVGLNLLGAYLFRTYHTLKSVSIYMAQRGHIQIRKEGSVEGFDRSRKKFILTPEMIEKIQSKIVSPFANEIEFTGGTLTTTGLLSNGQKSHPVIVVGFENESYVKAIKHPYLTLHGYFWLMPWQTEKIDDFKANTELMAVTPLIAEIMNFKTPLESNESVQVASMTLDGDLNAVNADLGALHSTGAEFLEGSVVLVPLKKVQELLGSAGLEAFTVFLKEGVSENQLVRKMTELALTENLTVEVFPFSNEKINPYYAGSLGFLLVMGSFFLILICTAVSLTIVNSLTMGIIERTREIGTLRAIGFTPKQVRIIFSRESLLVSFLAMAIGVILSALISQIVNSSHILFEPPGTPRPIPFKLLWSPWISVGIFFLLTLVAWLSATIVIRSKMKRRLISLLNDVGEE